MPAMRFPSITHIEHCARPVAGSVRSRLAPVLVAVRTKVRRRTRAFARKLQRAASTRMVPKWLVPIGALIVRRTSAPDRRTSANYKFVISARRSPKWRWRRRWRRLVFVGPALVSRLSCASASRGPTGCWPNRCSMGPVGRARGRDVEMESRRVPTNCCGAASVERLPR